MNRGIIEDLMKETKTICKMMGTKREKTIAMGEERKIKMMLETNVQTMNTQTSQSNYRSWTNKSLEIKVLLTCAGKI